MILIISIVRVEQMLLFCSSFQQRFDSEKAGDREVS